MTTVFNGLFSLRRLYLKLGGAVGLDVGGWSDWLAEVVRVSDGPRIQSLAVLPLENLAGDLHGISFSLLILTVPDIGPDSGSLQQTTSTLESLRLVLRPGGSSRIGQATGHRGDFRCR